MPCRLTRAATLALAFGAVLTGPLAVPAGEPPASDAKQGEAAAKKDTADAKKPSTSPRAQPDDPGAATVRSTAGGADIPVGVTLLGPRPPAAIAREQLRPGVTLLGPPPRVTWPRVIYSEPESVPSLAAGLLPPLALPRAGRPVPRPPQPIARLPRAAEPGVQLAPLSAPPMTVWTAFPGSGDWTPQSAYPDADPGSPYPWNPVRWGGGDWLENAWSPSSAWPPGVSADDWSPVLWSSPPAWTEWQPHDAWDRLFEPEESGADDTASGIPLAPAGRSRQD
jgi:hypothetical protein